MSTACRPDHRTDGATGLVNAVARPTLFSLPLVLLTLGLFLLIINAVTLSFTIWISEQLDLGLTSAGFGSSSSGR